MPLILKTYPFEGATLGLWHITETAEWFTERLLLNDADRTAMQPLTHPTKLLEFLASRYLLRVLIGTDDEHTMIKDEHGKPYLQQPNVHISISHCKGHAAAIISQRAAVGIDIEVVHPRVKKIVDKFLSDEELAHLGGHDATTHNLTLAWAVKEAVYKANGKKGISLRSQMPLGSKPQHFPNIWQCGLITDGTTTYYPVHVDVLNDLVMAFLQV